MLYQMQYTMQCIVIIMLFEYLNLHVDIAISVISVFTVGGNLKVKIGKIEKLDNFNF